MNIPCHPSQERTLNPPLAGIRDNALATGKPSIVMSDPILRKTWIHGRRIDGSFYDTLRDCACALVVL